MPYDVIKKRLRLDHFMEQALTRYYHNRDPLGADGDFTTAPEISQLFGEMIGIWAVQQWIKLGSPKTFNLIEIGPGRGTLMADLLRGTQHMMDFHQAMAVHLVETSPTLIEKQKDTLKTYDVQWHTHLNQISTEYPAIIIANEFLDALPVRQFKFNDTTWQECYVDGSEFVWLDIESPPRKHTLPDPQRDDIYEYSKAQTDYIELVKHYSGAYLFIDYGYSRSAYGDSLQALHKHKPCRVTDHIGEADLTTHIDFEWLASLFPDHIRSIKSQQVFLQENGINVRYAQLNNQNLQSGYDRLIHPDQMGLLFKTLEVTSPNP